jgi:hypothetical protein
MPRIEMSRSGSVARFAQGVPRRLCSGSFGCALLTLVQRAANDRFPPDVSDAAHAKPMDATGKKRADCRRLINHWQTSRATIGMPHRRKTATSLFC